MTCRVFADSDVKRLSAAVAVSAMRAALIASHEGRLSAPPRLRSELGDVAYTFTVGGIAESFSGFRAYRVGELPGDQLVAVWGSDGSLDCIVVGTELGARRTGALGAVAADALAIPDARRAAVVGSGHQAWTQLWALSAVRDLQIVRVYSPDPAHRNRFAQAAAAQLGLTCVAVDSAEEAVSEAQLVVLATRSQTPVIDAAHISPGTHLTTVGPKGVDGHETPLELLEAAAVVTCDSPAQAASYASPFFSDVDALVDLSAVLSGAVAGRRSPGDITVHCSVGLAGTEVALAAALLRASPAD